MSVFCDLKMRSSHLTIKEEPKSKAPPQRSSSQFPNGYTFVSKLKDGTRVVEDSNRGVMRLRCAGLDVHKSTIMAAVCITDQETLQATYYVREFTTMNSDLQNLVCFLKSHNVQDVCMESTGKYWIPIYDTLLAQGLKPVLTHPKYVKQIPGKKTDFKDAINIVNMFRAGRVSPSFIPPEDIRNLREILRYQIKLVAIRTSEKNRMQNCMTISRLRIDSVFKDPFGKSGTSILQYLLYSDPADVSDKDILKLVAPQVKASNQEILDSIHGYEFPGPIRSKMIIIFEHMESVNHALAEIDKELLSPYKKKYSDFIARLKTIPGISDASALYILSEIGNDMTVWTSSDQLARWAGLAPGNNSSGKKDRKTKTSNGGHVLVPILVQCALASLKVRNGYFAIKYENIKSRRGHKRAIIAIARMMLVAIYHMLTKGQDFNPTDLKKVLSRTNSRQIRQSDVMKYLKEQGIPSETLKSIQDHLKEPGAKETAETSAKKTSYKTKKDEQTSSMKQSSTQKSTKKQSSASHGDISESPAGSRSQI